MLRSATWPFVGYFHPSPNYFFNSLRVFGNVRGASPQEWGPLFLSCDASYRRLCRWRANVSTLRRPAPDWRWWSRPYLGPTPLQLSPQRHPISPGHSLLSQCRLRPVHPRVEARIMNDVCMLVWEIHLRNLYKFTRNFKLKK